MAEKKVARARVLVDNGHSGEPLKCGQIVEGSAEEIKALKVAGVIDDHAEAVAAAESEGSSVVFLGAKAAAEKAAAEKAAAEGGA